MRAIRLGSLGLLPFPLDSKAALLPSRPSVQIPVRPPINRLAARWRDITGTDWLRDRTLDQLDALKRDFAPVDAIRGQIDLAIEHRRQRRMW